VLRTCFQTLEQSNAFRSEHNTDTESVLQQAKDSSVWFGLTVDHVDYY